MLWSENDSRRLADQLGNSDQPIEGAAAVIGAMCGVIAFYQGVEWTKNAIKTIHDQIGVTIAVPPGQQPRPTAKGNGAMKEEGDET